MTARHRKRGSHALAKILSEEVAPADPFLEDELRTWPPDRLAWSFVVSFERQSDVAAHANEEDILISAEVSRRIVVCELEEGWELVLSLVEHAGTNRALMFVAAGPLEDYLARFGESVIARVEQTARADPKFRESLAGVWQSTIRPDIFARIQTAAGWSPSPEVG